MGVGLLCPLNCRCCCQSKSVKSFISDRKSKSDSSQVLKISLLGVVTVWCSESELIEMWLSELAQVKKKKLYQRPTYTGSKKSSANCSIENRIYTVKIPDVESGVPENSTAPLPWTCKCASQPLLRKSESNSCLASDMHNCCINLSTALNTTTVTIPLTQTLKKSP